MEAGTPSGEGAIEDRGAEGAEGAGVWGGGVFFLNFRPRNCVFGTF